MRRVVITGMGAVSPLGQDVGAMMAGLYDGRSAVRRMEGWDKYIGLSSLVAAPVEMKDEKLIPRQKRRFMGRMSIFAVQAAEQALVDSGLSLDEVHDGRVGCVVGSTMGSAESLSEAFESMFPDYDLTQMTSVKFFQCVSHTASMNVAHQLGITGVVMATSAACASGLQGIGLGYDLIRNGRQDAMLCGGAEGLHPTVTGSFDVLYATSAGYNDEPRRTPRPFDKDRDGLVCGEGSGILLLEEYEHAVSRKAPIYAEVVGYHTCGNGSHVSQSDSLAMVKCMREAMDQADVCTRDVGYLSAHATATRQGDVAEAAAIREVFSDTVPVSSLKGYIGHTLGASGAIELVASLNMMKDDELLPTLNLENVDSECAGIQHLQSKSNQKVDVLLKNSFAFGGINAVLICRKI